jgi:hypothetical protein
MLASLLFLLIMLHLPLFLVILQRTPSAHHRRLFIKETHEGSEAYRAEAKLKSTDPVLSTM